MRPTQRPWRHWGVVSQTESDPEAGALPENHSAGNGRAGQYSCPGRRKGTFRSGVVNPSNITSLRDCCSLQVSLWAVLQGWLGSIQQWIHPTDEFRSWAFHSEVGPGWRWPTGGMVWKSVFFPFILSFNITALVITHLLLQETGSKIPFYPYSTLKDILGVLFIVNCTNFSFTLQIY